MEQFSPEELMKNSIYGVWYTEDVLSLFQYIKEQEKKGDPLILTGFDIQGMKGVFNQSTYQWINQVNPAKAELLTQAETEFFTLLNSQTHEEFLQKKQKLTRQYEELEQFVNGYTAELKAHSSHQPQSVDILQQSLKLRKEIMNVYMVQQMKLDTGQPIEHLEDHPFFLRDRMMAQNFQWIAEELYPNKKIVVWGHNYHLRKQNTKVIKDFTSITPTGPNMGDYLPERLKKQSYTIGIYAYSGASLGSDNQTIFHVNSTHNPTSLEALLKKVQHPYVFVDFLQARYNKGTSWIYTPRINLYWGIYEEQMILKEQYDGIIWIDNITPSIII